MNANNIAHDLWDQFQLIHCHSPKDEWDSLLSLAKKTANDAFDLKASSRLQAELSVHRVLYALYAGAIVAPWEPCWKDLDHYLFVQLRQTLEQSWNEYEIEQYANFFGGLPQAEHFESWANKQCETHRSNLFHPLFSYLRDSATRLQLTEFLVQETPFDVHFGDILAKMLPGVYGDAKTEFSKNFWDEMGCGDTSEMHRQLRVDMIKSLGVCEDVHLLEIERFCVEELRLANMYFHTAYNRALLPQAIGMMLATELMVPGRLDQQIEGWRRVGLSDIDMRYLTIHTVVDVEHAAGWMNEVVKPLIMKDPSFIPAIAFGMARRLEHAAQVCDHMATWLPTLSNSEPTS
ncbi:iron-containing redox enzyme family protein [Pseudomonas fragariae (ex Marin et al. 2024)]|uniref:iron-containing redox enzyme family protein n=1 Tax=Pseudomonas TaxID=286 RepID=UPI0004453244|nr:iron-containing redox enzyme family protein [Pseudomonas syringae]AKF43782.1 hypothetical protein PsyrB_01155 [Pseudomonas syringae pv. syringae B301D]EXL29604.1 hypothetical protein PssB301D_04191 [Pseudomonas syringae pv. syringae str. B301D-R]POP80620.1 iron-containing redox enzyme family protein [Pseudomonas syringae]